MQQVFTAVVAQTLAIVALLMSLAGAAVADQGLSLPAALNEHEVVLVAKAVRRVEGQVTLTPELIIKGKLDEKEFDLPETLNRGRLWEPLTLVAARRYLLMLERDERGRLIFSRRDNADSVRQVDSVDDTEVRTAAVLFRLMSGADAAARTNALERAWIEESDKVKERVLSELLELGRDEATVPFLERCIEAGAERSSLMELSSLLIGKFAYRDTIPVLLRALEKDHWSCVYPAQALGKLKVREAHEPLLALINSPIAGNRAYFVAALCDLDDARSIPFLMETAGRNLKGIDPAAGTHRSWDLRENEAAITGLGRLRATEAADVLKQIAGLQTYAELRKLAQEALQAIAMQPDNTSGRNHR